MSFDADKSKIGKIYNNVEIRNIADLKESINEFGVKIAIITAPAQFAQEVVDLLVESGIKAILNFAPTTLRVPEKVILRNVDLSLELEALSFFLTHKRSYDNEFSFLYM